jgi:hypothetical protein
MPRKVLVGPFTTIHSDNMFIIENLEWHLTVMVTSNSVIVHVNGIYYDSLQDMAPTGDKFFKAYQHKGDYHDNFDSKMTILSD